MIFYVLYNSVIIICFSENLIFFKISTFITFIKFKFLLRKKIKDNFMLNSTTYNKIILQFTFLRNKLKASLYTSFMLLCNTCHTIIRRRDLYYSKNIIFLKKLNTQLKVLFKFFIYPVSLIIA